MVAVHNYTWEQGEDLVLSMLYKQGPVGAEVPVDLTGYQLRMDIVTPAGERKYTFNSDAIIDVDPTTPELEGDTEEEAVLGADGSIAITIPRTLTLPGGEVYDDITATPPVNTFNYDVFLRDPSDKQKKILKGTITVEKSVTLWA